MTTSATKTPRPTSQAVARIFLHDVECMSECSGDAAVYHARRTQGPFAKDAVAAWRRGCDQAEMAFVIHTHKCVGCSNEAAHTTGLESLADRLIKRLSDAA